MTTMLQLQHFYHGSLPLSTQKCASKENGYAIIMSGMLMVLSLRASSRAWAQGLGEGVGEGRGIRSL